MSMSTLFDDIHTPRVFIPAATGWTHTGRTYGINVKGYFKELYSDFKHKGLGNFSDDIKYMRPFYDLLREKYGVEFSYPELNPYAQYVDYMKSIGGGFSVEHTATIEHLRKHCHTLVIPDEAEFKQIKAVYDRYREYAATRILDEALFGRSKQR